MKFIFSDTLLSTYFKMKNFFLEENQSFELKTPISTLAKKKKKKNTKNFANIFIDRDY